MVDSTTPAATPSGPTLPQGRAARTESGGRSPRTGASLLDATRPASPAVVTVVVAAGLVLHLALALAAPRYAFVGDHVANLLWGMAAADHGLTHVYDLKLDDLPRVTGTMVDAEGRRMTETVQPTSIGLPNHPPLAIAVYWAQAKVLRALTADPVLNSPLSRLVVAGGQVVFDGALAVGVGLLAATLFGGLAFRRAAALSWLSPPFFLNSTFWGQMDVPFLAVTVFAVVLVLRGRWRAAGAVWGVSLLVKPQAVLLAPVIIFAALLQRDDDAGWPVMLTRLAGFGVAGALVAGLVSLPWTLAGGEAWLKHCYVDNIVHAYPLTTLRAFNVWYLDALRLDSVPALILDSHARLLGLSKDAWGRILLIVALAAIAALVRRRHRDHAEGTVVFAALWLWSAFMLPTRVHERYILYCLPFVIALTVRRRRWLPVLVALLVVGSAEHTWNLWMRDLPAGSLVTAEMVMERHSQDLADHARRRVSDARAGPKPTVADAAREVGAQAVGRRAHYLEERRAVRRAEVLVTLLSLLAYAGGLWSGLARPQGAVVRRNPRGREVGQPR